ncbi:hypothetical protein BBJ28_00016015 [Nothophytophthora sp. Chile5]|nr:hypothetical protein BBJ28_00016015 [Nothophytophthora sp. Chile5]
MLVHGGSSPDCGALADLFLLHIPIDDADDAPTRLRWEKLSAVGEHPEARELHCALMQTESTVCFAGGRNHDGKVCTDMVLLDVDRWKWQLVPMCEWNRCSLAAGVVDGELLSFGGWDGGRICGDCWRYRDDEESWLPVNVVATESKQAATEPSTTASPEIEARFGHCGTTVTMHSSSGSGEKMPLQALLVFGGMNAHSDLNDLVLITPNQHSHA